MDSYICFTDILNFDRTIRDLTVSPERIIMQIEKTEVWITCDKPLEGDERTVRGVFVLDFLTPALHDSVWTWVKRKRKKMREI